MSANALRNLVIGLGLLILLAFAGVIWGIVGATGPDGNGPVSPLARDISLGLPAGCDIVSAQTVGETLTIVAAGTSDLGEACARVFLVDLASGEVISQIAP